MTAAGLTFLGWVRTGLASGIARPADRVGNALDDRLPARSTVAVTLTLGDTEATFGALLAGPGDAVGLDERQVIRCDPPPGAIDADSSDFPMIEFDRPDLPWLLTPDVPAETGLASDDARRGLRPWLCLVVVPERALDPPTGKRPLPRLSVSDAELPELESAWLWAHAQVVTVAGDDIEDVIRDHPDRTLSRLLAPRRLRAGLGYLACVVPTFEAGRRAGLGLEDAGPAAVQSPAWTRGATPRDVVLPVLYSWRFRTGAATGNFETLARKLRAVRQGRAGITPIDVGAGDSGLPQPAPNAAPWLMDLEGAIVGDQVVPGAWPDGWGTGLREAIAVRLAAAAGELAPPTYGSLQARSVDDLRLGQGPRWLRELNLDPRYRVTASLGAQIVQKHQEALVASAWQQAGALRDANRLLRQAQLARTLGESLNRRLGGSASLGSDRLLQITRPLHGLLPSPGNGGAWVATVLARNVALDAAASVAFRRSARPLGPLAARLFDKPLPAPMTRLALPALAANALRPTGELKAVPGAIHLGVVSASASAPESIGTLTPVRLLTAILPWEIGWVLGPLLPGGGVWLPPAGPQPAPVSTDFAYLADLIVVGTSAVLGRSLDFDGAPQQGWMVLQERPEFAGRYGVAYVEREGARGVLTLDPILFDVKGSVSYELGYYWRRGNALDHVSAIRVSLRPSMSSFYSYSYNRLEHSAVAIADIGDSGAIDVVVAWVVYASWGTIEGASMRFDSYSRVFMMVGLDLDPYTGYVRGNWKPVQDLGRWDGTRFSLSARGAVLYRSNEHTLSMSRLTMDGTTTPLGQVGIADQLPDDVVSTTLCAADFGGGLGTDLLIACVSGQGPGARASYRIAFDVKAGQSIGSWSASQDLPVSAAGGRVDLCLGSFGSITALLRVLTSNAFRRAAAQSQDRQQRIAALAAPPAPAPAVDTVSLVDALRTGTDPLMTVPATVASRLVLPRPIVAGTLRDVLQPLALTPQFPYPTFQLLREEALQRLFPGAADIPVNGVAALFANRPMIEAFLIGMNHEFSRELLWRDFPVDHGTFFSRFWAAARQEISPIEGWPVTSALGAHGPTDEPASLLMLVTRAELFERIPNATVYASPARPAADGNGRSVDTATRRDPLFQITLGGGLRVFAFDLSAAVARGVSSSDGWYFVVQEHPGAPRFGLDDAVAGFGSVPAAWSELVWPQVVRTSAEFEALVHVDAGPGSALAGTTLPDGGSSTMRHRWGFSAAHMAHITLQRPVQLAIHGSRLIHPDVAP